MVSKADRIEQLEIIELLSRAEKTDRRGDGSTQRDHAAALRSAVQLRDHETSERYRLRKFARLLYRVLADRGIEDKQ